MMKIICDFYVYSSIFVRDVGPVGLRRMVPPIGLVALSALAPATSHDPDLWSSPKH